MTAEDPGIVFSVKELIGRLDGKLDTTANLLATKLDTLGQIMAGKADRADVNQVSDRVSRLEKTVADMHQREVEREAARLAKREADEKAEKEARAVETEHRDNHRFTLTTFIAAFAALAAIAAVVVTTLGVMHH